MNIEDMSRSKSKLSSKLLLDNKIELLRFRRRTQLMPIKSLNEDKSLAINSQPH